MTRRSDPAVEPPPVAAGCDPDPNPGEERRGPDLRVDPLQLIPIDQIEVLNTRDRNSREFAQIVANIKAVGIKKPICVTPRPRADGQAHYLLICGEGRLKAFRTLGETTIPALVVSVGDEDAFLMGLTENIARRRPQALESLDGIAQLRDRGYSGKAIALKTGLTPSYIHGILTLMARDEHRLLAAVQGGRIPLNAAINIVVAGEDDAAVEAALLEAYETGKLRGRRLGDARRVLDRRSTLGPSLAHRLRKPAAEVSTSSLVRGYEKEVSRQRLMVRKQEFAQQCLLFVVRALQQLLLDDNFVNLLRAEGLSTLPKYLSERVWPEGRPA
jgi:ParB family chromosome partitioning protein